MRIPCPHCGDRDRREYTWAGDALALSRPDPAAGAEEWHDYVHIRDNPAGPTRDLWYHDPCGTWIAVDRNTVTHAITAVTLAAEVAR